VVLIKVYCTTAFRNRLKDCRKRTKSIYEDADRLIKTIVNAHLHFKETGKRVPIGGSEEIPGLGLNVPAFKQRKMLIVAERSEKGYRVIYAIGHDFLIMVDIYHKSKRENHDVNLIRKSLKEVKENHESEDLIKIFLEIPNMCCSELYTNDT
jgi:hypothetical protein